MPFRTRSALSEILGISPLAQLTLPASEPPERRSPQGELSLNMVRVEFGYPYRLSQNTEMVATWHKEIGVAARHKGTVRVLELATRKAIILSREDNCPTGPIFHPGDGDVLATSCWDGTVRLWFAPTGGQIAVIRRAFPKHDPVIGGACFADLVFSRDGTILATSCRDKRVRLWDVARPRSIFKRGRTLKTTETVETVTFSPDSKTLAIHIARVGFELWDLAVSQRVGIIPRAWNAAFSHDSKILACNHSDGTVGLWDVATCVRTGEIAIRSKAVRLVFNADGKTLAISGDGCVELWNAATRELIGTLNDDAGTVNAIVFSPDGKLLAIGSDNAVSLWDIATRERVETLAVGHELVDVKFRPDGKILAALCVSSVCRWDVSDLVVT